MSENIAREIKRGRAPAQAKAIAMSTLAKSCGLSPARQAKARQEGWPVKKIIRRMKKNPFPLMVIGLANPQTTKGFSRVDIDFAARKWRDMYGPKAKMNRVVVDIPGVADGSVGVVRGKPLAIEYAFSNVRDSVKPTDGHRHVEGDTGSGRIKPARSVIIDIVKNGKIQTTVIARNKNAVDNEGYYIS